MSKPSPELVDELEMSAVETSYKGKFLILYTNNRKLKVKVNSDRISGLISLLRFHAK